MISKVLVVSDSETGCEAVYVDGKLRGEFEKDELTSAQLIECSNKYVGEGRPAIVTHAEISSHELSIFEPMGGEVYWPIDAAELKLPSKKTPVCN